jgi:hypothetical protein
MGGMGGAASSSNGPHGRYWFQLTLLTRVLGFMVLSFMRSNHIIMVKYFSFHS